MPDDMTFTLHGDARSARQVADDLLNDGFDVARSYEKRRATGMIPMSRPGRVDEVASMVGYLAREEAGFVTGQVLSVNGGSSMG